MRNVVRKYRILIAFYSRKKHFTHIYLSSQTILYQISIINIIKTIFRAYFPLKAVPVQGKGDRDSGGRVVKSTCLEIVLLSFRGLLASRRNLYPFKPPLCKGRWLGYAEAEGLPAVPVQGKGDHKVVEGLSYFVIALRALCVSKDVAWQSLPYCHCVACILR